MKFERRKIAVALAYALGGAALIAGTAVQAQTYVVTGSGIPRAEAEGALPVQVITKEEIARTGVQSVEELIQTVSAISSQNATQLANASGNSTYGFSGASLRGLGSARTLVLMNGRRMAPFSSGSGTGGVNINNIPLSAIERVEVLKDGASAIYGADAIAGVINFIMVNNYQGAEANFYTAQPTRSGGGQSYMPSAVMGYGDYDKDRFNLTVSVQYENQAALFAKDRDFANTGNRPPWFTAGATGQGNIEGAWIPGTGSAANGTWVEGKRAPNFGGTSPASGWGNPVAATNQCESILMFKNLSPTSGGPVKGLAPYCAFDSATRPNLIPAVINTGLTGNFRFKLSDTTELFATALWSQSEMTNAIQESPVRRSFLISDDQFKAKGIDPVLLIYPSNPNYATAANYLKTLPGGSALVGQPLAITSRVFDFGPRTNQDTSSQINLTAGARGTWAKQDWEINYQYNKNKLDGTVTDGYFSQTAYAKIVQGSNDWNPWSLTQSPSFVSQLPAAKYVGPTLNAVSDSNTIEAHISGDVMQLPAGPLQYNAGYSWSKGTLKLSPAPALFTGDIAGLGGATAAVDESRTVNALYAELAIPIVKSLDATLQGRYDDYNDVGSKFTYKGSLRWQPTKQYLVRASYGTGFRPPTLPDLWVPQTLGTSEQFSDPATGEDNLQVPALSGGNPKLKPETSKQYQIGGVWSPTPAFSFGADYFHIKLDGIISTPSAQEVVSQYRLGDPAYQNLVILQPGTNQIDQISVFSVNTGKATIEGWDFEAYWREKFSFGNINLSYYGTYMTKYDQTSPGGVLSHKVGTIVDGTADANPVLDANTGGVILRYKHILQLTWSDGPWAVTATQNWYNGYETAPRQIDGERNFVSTTQLYDLRIAYTGIKNVNLAIGARNIFDKNPDIFVPVSNQFQAGYDINMYDPRARFIYGTVGVKF